MGYQEERSESQKKTMNLLIKGGIALLVFIVILWINPISYNDPTERTVVTGQGGGQKVVFEPGMYWAGLFAKEVTWPNQIGVSYKGDAEDLDLVDNTVEIAKVKVQFSDGTTAMVEGIAQYILPTTDKEMLEIHNAHRTPEGLVKRRLAPYTKECLQASAQRMSSEMHYSGGRAQMTQDYLNQLQNGSYLLKVQEIVKFDSVEKTTKRSYDVAVQMDVKGQFMRKFSSIKEYNIKVSDANIVDTDYETAVDSMLAKKIASSTRASVSRQELMTAQQQGLTAKAEGEKKLIVTEYAKKVEQTNAVVAAETKVKLAEQYKAEQKMAAEAAIFASQKVKTDADAAAYAASRMVSAGLSPIDKAEYEMKTKIGVAAEIAKIKLPDTYISGGNGGNTTSLIDALLSTKLIEK